MGGKILEMTDCSLFPYHLLPFFTNKEKQISAVFSIKMMIEKTVIFLFQKIGKDCEMNQDFTYPLDS